MKQYALIPSLLRFASLSILCATWLVLLGMQAQAADKLSFDKHIRPILSENCFHCHGPDGQTQEADLALHNADDASAVIVPGDPRSSELVARIFDEEDPMPPADSNRSLTEEQKQMLRQWIEEGAEYQKHWAFFPPTKAPLPTGSAEVHPIDQFVGARLEQEGLEFANEAEKQVLARRASLALTGLLPTPKQMQAFLADESTEAYGRFVDELLDSMAYAERMTLFWMDAARYADTDGYQNDAQRKNWPWRDWVIAAYRDNMPFDQFTVEQLAGDMLPNATHSQRLASAFNRNHRQNAEGGALAEEFFVENVIDRVETTSTVWLGLTTGCARCHDHKYDPISQKEFYQLFAYFNNIGERGIGKGVNANPVMLSRSPLRELPEELRTRLETAKQELAEAKAGIENRRHDWADDFYAEYEAGNQVWNQVKLASSATITFGDQTKHAVPQSDNTYQFAKYAARNVSYRINFPTSGQALAGLELTVHPAPHLGEGARFGPSKGGNFIVTDLSLEHSDAEGTVRDIKITEATASYQQPHYEAKKAIDGDKKSGWAVYGSDMSKPIKLWLQFDKPIQPDEGAKLTLSIDHNSNYDHHTIGRLSLATTTRSAPSGLTKEVVAILQKPRSEWKDKQKKEIREHYEKIDAQFLNASRELSSLEGKLSAEGYGEVTVMVMNESDKVRPAYLLNRGQYTDPDKSEELQRTVPEALLTSETKVPGNRLELARWLMSRENPITARVVVNRMWQRMFGVGLVKTSEDFGSQGERPSHPELLDWLAVDFIESGWDVKRLYRIIATSRTFRQSSRVTTELHSRDPENRLLARGPRFRMDGFALRDMALQSAGLLNLVVGGAPVKPYQPAGLWSTLGSSAGDRYRPDQGNKLYRKSMYTYWRRAVNPPRQTIFDASGREVCNVRHRVTNTPLQALALMNDETFVEAARHLAARMIKEGGKTPSERIAHGYQLATSYAPKPQTLEVLTGNLDFFLEHYGQDKQAANEYLAIGSSPVDKTLDPSEHAAYAATAHLMLNLDEALVIE